MRLLRNFVLIFIFLILSTNKLAVAEPSSETTTADFTYIQAEKDFLKNNLPDALKKVTSLLVSSTKNIPPYTLARAYNLRGLIYYQLNNYREALIDFERAVDIANQNFDKDDRALHLARYNLANALFKNNQYTQAAEVLRSINPELLEPNIKIRLYNLMGNTFSLLDQNVAAIVSYLFAANYTADTATANTLINKAFSFSKKIYLHDINEDVKALEHYADKLPNASPAYWCVKIIVAKGALYLGKNSYAEEILQNFLNNPKNVDHPLRTEADEMLRRIHQLSIVNAQQIGLLLPLSGKFEKFGRMSLNAALMALKVFEQTNNASPITYIIEDAGETEESALAAFEKLVMEDHVIAVIGPMLSRQSPVISSKAQEYGVPIFNLSQKQNSDSEQKGSFVFPMALTPEQQIETIVSFVTQKRGFHRFAVLAPNDDFGNKYADIFWNEVEKRGGEIVGFEQYTPGSTDFHDEIKKLTNLYYPEARQLEIDQLKKQADEYGSQLKVRGILRRRLLQKFDPKANVDFDAIFIPDGPQAVGQIAPSFAVKEVDKITYLGINTWNTVEIIQRAGKYLQNALFVDSFISNTKNPNMSKFIDKFKALFQNVPGTLEAQAFDAANAIIQTLTSNNINTRGELRNQVISTAKYSGISGDFHFTENNVKRTAYLLTIKGSEIQEVPQ